MKVIETPERIRIVDKRGLLLEKCSFYEYVYKFKLEYFYKNKVITEDQYEDGCKKLNDQPSDIEECLKYLERINEDLYLITGRYKRVHKRTDLWG